MPTTLTSPLPIVSIIIRTQNRLSLLREALQSLVSQTYQHIEVIVVNDGGENCEAVAQQFQSQLTVQVISLPQSMGRSHVANLGLQAAQGKYINFLDDDDILYPDHIEKLATFLELTGKKVAYTDCEAGHYHFVAGEGFILQREKYLYKGVDFDQNQLYFENFLPIMTVMVRRDIALINGGFDESLEVFEDWDYWIRLSHISDFQRIPGVTCEYRFFSNYNYDFQHWRTVIYQKHADYWTMERLNQTAWQRIKELELSKLHLQNILNHTQKRLQQMSHSIEELNDTSRTQTIQLERFDQTQKSLAELLEKYEHAQSQVQQQETQILILESQQDHLTSQLQELESQKIQFTLQLQEQESQNDQLAQQLQDQIAQFQDLKLHSHVLEQRANEPGCMIGLYRSLIPLTIRLRLHDLRQTLLTK